jgi:hypothetical protein
VTPSPRRSHHKPPPLSSCTSHTPSPPAMVVARAPSARWLDSPPTCHLPQIPSTRGSTNLPIDAPPLLIVPKTQRRWQSQNSWPPIPCAPEIHLTGDDALPAIIIANKWHKPNHREVLVPMLPSAPCFSLVSADVPVVAASHAPPSMAPLCRVRFYEERIREMLP